MKYLDDVLEMAGCGVILYGTWRVAPGAFWFVLGGMLIVMGILIGIGNRKAR